MVPAVGDHGRFPPPPPPKKQPPPSIKVYPALAEGLLRQKQTAAGRLWLLFRFLDKNGAGWLEEADACRQVTEKSSPWRLCGKRQWRNLLKKGEGTFWQRQNGRLWLNSVSKTAAALGVWQLNGRPVLIPLPHLTESIGSARAHLYAAFHSSRTGDAPKPIARGTLAAKFNITPRTQRAYEQKARVQTRHNYAIGKQETKNAQEQAAWQQGTAVFSFTDYAGKLGRPNRTYLAWQLPNQYRGPHQQTCRGRQKRINRELADLFMKGMTGNDKNAVETTGGIPKRFCGNGRIAATLYQKQAGQQDVYWQSPGSNLWHVMEKSDN